FPDSGGTRLASASAPSYGSSLQVTSSVTTNRLAGVDEVLRQQASPATPQQPVFQPQPQQVAYARSTATQVQRLAPVQRKIWLQLASGSNSAALAGEFRQIKSKNRDLFDGIPGYVAKSPDRARLVIG